MTSKRYARCGPRLAALAGAMMVAIGPALANEIVWARYGDIDSLDPHRATSTLSMQVWDQIYDTLLAFDENGVARPNLAKSWTVSDDGLTYTFSLEEGVKCHDGTDFGAKDVKFTIDRAFGDNPSLTQTSWGPIESVEVVDDLTVTVKLESTVGAFLPFLADSFSSMVCASNGDDPEFGSATGIGTGPFKLASWVKGDEVVLERNDDYRNFGKPVENDGPVHIDRLIVRTIPEAQTRLAAQPCSPALSQRLQSAAPPDTPRLPSGATHDASAMADLCPVAMMFTRCRDGISHHPSEYASPEDMEAAVQTLVRFVQQPVGGVA